jgi:hypothetical protein
MAGVDADVRLRVLDDVSRNESELTPGTVGAMRIAHLAVIG